MVDIIETIMEYSYIGIFFLLIAVNAAPILMPPTWIILSSFFALDTSLDPFILALVGATGATIGRFFLKRISGLFRRFVGKEQESNLDAIANFLNKKKIWIHVDIFSVCSNTTSQQYVIHYIWDDEGEKYRTLYRILVW